jgi:hypothetical protein
MATGIDSALFFVLHCNSIAFSVLHNSGQCLCLVGNGWALFSVLHCNSIAFSVLHNSGHCLRLVGNGWALFYVYFTIILLLFQCCITVDTVCASLPPAERFFLSFTVIIFLFQCCITVDTVCALLATAERYIQYKCTKFLIQKVIF